MQQLLDDADKAIKARNLDLASIQLKNAVRLAPQNGLIRARLASILLSQRQYVAAERELRQSRNDGAPDELVVPGILQCMTSRNEMKELLADFPDPAEGSQSKVAPDILIARAQAFQALGRPAEAKTAMERSLKYRRTLASLIVASRLARQQNDLPLARNLAEEAFKGAPNNADALAMWVQLERDGGQTQQALASVQDFIKRVPNTAVGRILEVDILIGMNEDAKAKEKADQLAKGQPLYGAYYRAILLYRAKDLKNAWSAAQSLPPEFVQSQPAIVTKVASIAAASGNLESAGAMLTTQLSLNPETKEVRLQLAAVRIAQNSATAAIDLLAPLKTSPDPFIQTLLAQAYLQLHRSDDALTAMEMAVAAGAGNDFLKRQLALVELEAGKTDAAVAGLQDLSDRDPGNVALAGPLIASLARTGKADKALAVADRLAKANPKSAVPGFYRGQVHIIQGNLEAASTAFNEALTIDPSYVPALHYSADVALAKGDAERADAALKRILNQDPRNLLAYLKLAQMAVNANDQTRALSFLNKAIEVNPNDATPRLALAKYQVSVRNYPDAEGTATRLLQAMPNNSEGLAALGQIQLMRGATAAALRTFRSLAAQEAKLPAAQILLAQALSRTGDYPGAREAAKKAISLAPDASVTYAVLIDTEIADGKADNAVTVARNFATNYPGPDADLLLAGTLVNVKRTNDAIALLEKSVSSRPNRRVVLRLSQLAGVAGDRKKATLTLESWLKKNAEDADIRREYASLLLGAGDTQSARREFEIVLKQRAYDAVTLNNLGWIVLKDDPNRALSLVTQAEKIAPRSPEIVDTLGWIKYQRRDYKGALPVLQRAHDLDSNNSWISYHLALALDANGQRPQAKALLASAIAKNAKFDDIENAKKLLATW